MKGFPNKIKDYKILWYTEYGDYGSIKGDKNTYLAIAESREQTGMLLLFLGEYYSIHTVIPCDDEYDAFDTVVDVKREDWHRIDDEKSNLVNQFQYWIKKVMGLYKRSFLQLIMAIITLVCIEYITQLFPMYGKDVLWLGLLKHGLRLLFCVLTSLVIMYIIVFIKNKKLLFSIMIFLCSIPFIYMIGIETKQIINIGRDFQTKPQRMYVEMPSYTTVDAHRRRTRYYLTGIVNGEIKEYDVTGCNTNLLDCLTKTQECWISVYRHSELVVDIENVSELQQ